MTRVLVVGCGVVGAAIAYELSRVPGLEVTVLDRQPPALDATGAALGVLMGIISHKVKGNAWAMREASMQRYETLIPELENTTGATIPVNRDGIVLLVFDEADVPGWQQLAACRRQQGWSLDLWDAAQVKARCPQVDTAQVVAAIYSPGDRQIDPTALTLALVEAARRNGVQFHFDAAVQTAEFAHHATTPHCLHTTHGAFTADWVVIAAGLGSPALLRSTTEALGPVAPPLVEMQPVLGQAMLLKLDQTLGDRHFQPVITGNDIHLVPVREGEYWVGATVEFPDATGQVSAQPQALDAVLQGAIAFCPALAQATCLKTWSGLRPRPHHRPAPVVEPLAGHHRVYVATGHYRNGVLLAPATAQRVCDAILEGETHRG